jgi:hypothetical protein
MQQDIVTVGVDQAKTVFQIHAISAEGNHDIECSLRAFRNA